MALAAGDMVLDGDRGSPQPYPKDLIGGWVEMCRFDDRCWLCNLGYNLKRCVESKIVFFGETLNKIDTNCGFQSFHPT